MKVEPQVVPQLVQFLADAVSFHKHHEVDDSSEEDSSKEDSSE